MQDKEKLYPESAEEVAKNSVGDIHDPSSRWPKTDLKSAKTPLASIPNSKLKDTQIHLSCDMSAGPEALEPPQRRANTKRKNNLEGRTKVIDLIFHRRLNDTLQAISRKQKFALSTLDFLPSGSRKVDKFSETLSHALSTVELKRQGLWKDRLEEVTFADVFSNSSPSNDPRYYGVSKKLVDRGTFLEETDVTVDERVPGSEGTDLGMSTQGLYEYMRPPPRTLRQSVARRYADSQYFHIYFDERDFFLVTLIIARDAETPESFIDLLCCGFYGVAPIYRYLNFEIDRCFFEPTLKRHIDHFFPENSPIVNATKSQIDLKDPTNIWKRYNRVWKKLTAKQRHALRKLYMQDNQPKFNDVAESLRISVDSLRDRVRGGIEKFKEEFPELLAIKSAYVPPFDETSYYASWRVLASRPGRLYSVDPVTEKKTPIESLPKQPKKKPNIREVAKIRAWTYEEAPIPNFSFTEYFCGLQPGLFSQDLEQGVNDLIDDEDDDE